jgi:hypothetical protein
MSHVFSIIGHLSEVNHLDDGAEGNHSHYDDTSYLNKSDVSLQELNKHLSNYNLPAIHEWDLDPDQDEEESVSVLRLHYSHPTDACGNYDPTGTEGYISHITIMLIRYQITDISFADLK